MNSNLHLQNALLKISKAFTSSKNIARENRPFELPNHLLKTEDESAMQILSVLKKLLYCDIIAEAELPEDIAALLDKNDPLWSTKLHILVPICDERRRHFFNLLTESVEDYAYNEIIDNDLGIFFAISLSDDSGNRAIYNIKKLSLTFVSKFLLQLAKRPEQNEISALCTLVNILEFFHCDKTDSISLYDDDSFESMITIFSSFDNYRLARVHGANFEKIKFATELQTYFYTALRLPLYKIFIHPELEKHIVQSISNGYIIDYDTLIQTLEILNNSIKLVDENTYSHEQRFILARNKKLLSMSLQDKIYFNSTFGKHLAITARDIEFAESLMIEPSETNPIPTLFLSMQNQIVSVTNVNKRIASKTLKEFDDLFELIKTTAKEQVLREQDFLEIYIFMEYLRKSNAVYYDKIGNELHVFPILGAEMVPVELLMAKSLALLFDENAHDELFPKHANSYDSFAKAMTKIKSGKVKPVQLSFDNPFGSGILKLLIRNHLVFKTRKGNLEFTPAGHILYNLMEKRSGSNNVIRFKKINDSSK